MKVLNISTNTHGGAGSAALRIHKAFLNQDVCSYLFVKSNMSDFSDGIIKVKKWKRGLISIILKRLLIKILFKKKYLMYSLFDKPASNDIVQTIDELNIVPDIIILHWIADFINLEELLDLKLKYPNIQFFWYLMDMAPLTAGCHYAWGCENYNSSCSGCPAAKNSIGQLVVKKKFEKKFSIIKKIGLRYIAPNKFVADQACKIPYFGKTKHAYIPINDSIFYESTRETADFTILFGSGNFLDYRKGADLFRKVLFRLDKLIETSDNGGINILMPGFDLRSACDFKNLKMLEVCRAVGDYELANVYQLSDVFVCCSREDSGPMMISEAMMSGVPVVSFEVGAASELIYNNETGFLIENYDVNAMADAIFELYSGKLTKNLKQSVRKAALSRLSEEVFVERFLEVRK